ncbi:hypothetical protein BDV96DRAFT_599379 [Lophiotrema nucula]|uniref:FAD dependent oxidoreductase domain-containing protein n=1 Tax=Lophiotrema nucula TaxID=690887 RepID=A0A6A5Z8Q4_9PLEO|nr:hypothetical protein BDV96DRAFT_599379 [Lophiotrema nucula]
MNFLASLIALLSSSVTYAPPPIKAMGSLWPKPQEQIGFEHNNVQDGVVIIGGGIIGLSTAYSLALALNETVRTSKAQHRRRIPKITIVESSDRLCPAASSQATGGLGDFGFGENKTGVAGVSSLSYKMHVEMAAKYNGEEVYGFGEQLVYRLQPKNFTGTPSPADDWGSDNPPIPVPLSDLPSWVRTSDDWEARRLSSGPKVAHLDPKQFCPFLAERVKDLGVHFEMSANVTSVDFDTTRQSFASVEIRRASGSTHVLPCKAIVLAAGPWSDRIFSQLFPDAKVKLPMNSTGAAGNHIRIKIPGWKSNSKETSVQVYYTNVTPDGSRFDVTSFTNGDLYIGGWGAIPEEIPRLATFVHAQPSEVKAMLPWVKRYVAVDSDKELEYFDVGRCYRPTIIGPKRPIITKLDWELLSKDSTSCPSPSSSNEGDSLIAGGLIINTGHSSDGITLGLGSGKIASELVLGQTPSIDISSLGLPESARL